MVGKDYAEQMLAHLIDGLDCINARLVYLRAPDVFKKKSKELGTAWSLCQALSDFDFPKAFKLLTDDPNHQVLKRYLQHDFIPRQVKRVYERIERGRLAEMMGCAEGDLVKVMGWGKYQVQGTGKFVSVACEQNDAGFKLDSDRIQGLKAVAQYLEQ